MAKTYYCWRCKTEIPMLDDREWEEIEPLARQDIGEIKSYRMETHASVKEAIDTLPHRSCERYFQLTGHRERDPNNLWHHHLSHHGPECPACGHLLRTPRASFCANCGSKRQN